MPPMPASDGLPLRMDGVTLTATGGRLLLTVNQLTVLPGMPVAVRGPSGAGKSTLLMTLAGLIRPTTGRIVWGDTNIAALTEDARATFRRDHVGMIFQDFLLFDELDAQDNAALSAGFRPAQLRASLRAKASAMLASFGVGGTQARNTASFSGGERQRVAVARALATDPAILLADEPTASLDRTNADLLMDDLARIGTAPSRTLIAVTHDEGLIARMARVITIVDGCITDDSHA
jgi:ABC-type lipoprotein export system ATPase subunit